MAVSDALNPVVPFASPRKHSRVEQVPARVKAESDTAYAEDEPVTKEQEADQRESIHALMLGVTQLIKERNDKPSEMKRLWLPICAAVLISLGPPLWTANVMTRSNSDDLKTQLSEVKSMISDAKRDASDAAREAKRANNNYALLDVYNRELERALIRKGIALPAYPALEK